MNPWFLSIDYGAAGGSLPAVLNAANEIAVEAFLGGLIPFPRIWEIVETAMQAHTSRIQPELEELLAADQEARATARGLIHGSKAFPERAL